MKPYETPWDCTGPLGSARPLGITYVELHGLVWNSLGWYETPSAGMKPLGSGKKLFRLVLKLISLDGISSVGYSRSPRAPLGGALQRHSCSTSARAGLKLLRYSVAREMLEWDETSLLVIVNFWIVVKMLVGLS
jgi:hypothetical protein